MLPGCDGKSPSLRGTLEILPGVRSGRRRLNALGPMARRTRAFSISTPSPEGTVRARNTPMRALSSIVQSTGATPSAANSPGSIDGLLRTLAIQALMPSR